MKQIELPVYVSESKIHGNVAVQITGWRQR